MKVKELIEQLSKLDPELEVMKTETVTDGNGSWTSRHNVIRVEEIILNRSHDGLPNTYVVVIN